MLILPSYTNNDGNSCNHPRHPVVILQSYTKREVRCENCEFGTPEKILRQPQGDVNGFRDSSCLLTQVVGCLGSWVMGTLRTSLSSSFGLNTHHNKSKIPIKSRGPKLGFQDIHRTKSMSFNFNPLTPEQKHIKCWIGSSLFNIHQ